MSFIRMCMQGLCALVVYAISIPILILGFVLGFAHDAILRGMYAWSVFMEWVEE
ncbi:MAG: hypothetical protein ACM31O_17390 [Bacteroidota bacterium]